MIELANPQTYIEWEHAHREFHALLVRYAGERLIESILQLGDHARRYRHDLLSRNVDRHATDLFGPGMPEHLKIVEACERRDVAGAGILIADHLGRTALTLVSLSDPRHDPLAVREALRLTMPGD